jgi:hypothetical protein
VIVTAHDASGDTGQNCNRGIFTGKREFWPVSSELDGIRFGSANRRLQPLGHLTADLQVYVRPALAQNVPVAGRRFFGPRPARFWPESSICPIADPRSRYSRWDEGMLMIPRASRQRPGSCSKLCSSSPGFSGRHTQEPFICCKDCSARPVWHHAANVAGCRGAPVGLRSRSILSAMCRRTP